MITTQQRFWIVTGFVLSFLFLYYLSPILTPFFVGAFLAYLGDPLVNRLRRLNLSRTLAATIVFLVIMILVFGFLFFLIPLLARQITLLMNRLPEMLTWIQQFVLPWLQDQFGITLSFDVGDLKKIIAENWQQAGNIAAKVWKIFSHSGIAILAWFAKMLLIPVVTFYLLRDWDQVINGIRQLLPRRIEPTVVQLVQECDEVLSAFLRGQLLVMLALVILYTTGLALIGLDFALLLGSIAGILGIVPYLGVVVGIISSSIAALVQFHDWIYVIYVVVLFFVAHILENFVLTPWFVGDRIGLHPVAVIFAVLAGGQLFGVMGILLALPIAAIIMVLIRHLKDRYITSELYS